MVIDDCSQVDVGSVVRDIGDERIGYHRLDARGGAPAARNFGIRLSSGRYVAFLDDDDEWFPNKIELQLEDLKRKGAEYRISYCQREFFDDQKGRATGISRFGWDGDHLDAFLCGDIVPSTSCVLAERECLERVGGFREDLPRLQDRELWIRLSRHYPFAFVPQVLVRVHRHSGGRITDNKAALRASLSLVYRAHRDLLLRNWRLHSRFLLEIGYASQAAGDGTGARLTFIGALLVYPIRLEPYVALLSLVIKRRDRA